MSNRPHPLTLQVVFDRIPPSLKPLPRWVGWRWTYNQNKPSGHHQGWDKPPLNPHTGKLASTANPATWSTYQEAVSFVAREHLDGLGFNLLGLDNVVVHDLDDCRNPETGVITGQAMNIVQLVGGYWEISPSGTGIRGISWARKTGLRVEASKAAPVNGAQYDGSKGRYITLTGHTLSESTSNVCDAQPGGIEAAYNFMFPQREKTGLVPTPTSVGLDDTELLEKAWIATNGNKLKRLWDGDISGYASQSEADLALCCHLAFWTGGDPVKIDRLFKQSHLYRSKWDQRRGAATYGERTIQKALEVTTEFYSERSSPKAYVPTPPGGNGAKPSAAPDLGHSPLPRLPGTRRSRPAPPNGLNLFQRVKQAVSVEELAERFTQLAPAGPGKLKGRCPLHEERTPSFYVYQDSRRWQCFGACASGGDVVELARRLMDLGKLGQPAQKL